VLCGEIMGGDTVGGELASDELAGGESSVGSDEAYKSEGNDDTDVRPVLGEMSEMNSGDG